MTSSYAKQGQGLQSLPRRTCKAKAEMRPPVGRPSSLFFVVYPSYGTSSTMGSFGTRLMRDVHREASRELD